MRNSLRNFVIRVSYNKKLLTITYIVSAVIAFLFAIIFKKSCIAFLPLILMIPFGAVRDTNIDIVNRNNLFIICLSKSRTWADLVTYTPLILVTDLKIPFSWFTLIICIAVILLLLYLVPKRVSAFFKKKLK